MGNSSFIKALPTNLGYFDVEVNFGAANNDAFFSGDTIDNFWASLSLDLLLLDTEDNNRMFLYLLASVDATAAEVEQKIKVALEPFTLNWG